MENQDLEITKAGTEDCGLIHALAVRIFPATYKEILSQEQLDYMMDWMYAPANLLRQMAEQGHVYFIARTGGVPVGYVSVRPDGPDVWHLEKIYVLPEYQKAHYGGRLFCHAVDYVKAACPGVRAIELNVNRSNPALGFDLRQGMRIDRQGDFDIGHGFYMNDYIMRLDL